ncbi:hypothetical protein TNCV_5104531 [Trichonephila clavipes]|nr:hypothetical protein TNCV_5104531 [Trichonephila clavipes]
MVLKANDRRTSCPCHDEFRGPRSDYVRQVWFSNRRAKWRRQNDIKCLNPKQNQNVLSVPHHESGRNSETIHRDFTSASYNFQNSTFISGRAGVLPFHPFLKFPGEKGNIKL